MLLLTGIRLLLNLVLFLWHHAEYLLVANGIHAIALQGFQGTNVKFNWAIWGIIFSRNLIKLLQVLLSATCKYFGNQPRTGFSELFSKYFRSFYLRFFKCILFVFVRGIFLSICCSHPMYVFSHMVYSYCIMPFHSIFLLPIELFSRMLLSYQSYLTSHDET